MTLDIFTSNNFSNHRYFYFSNTTTFYEIIFDLSLLIVQHGQIFFHQGFLVTVKMKPKYDGPIDNI